MYTDTSLIYLATIAIVYNYTNVLLYRMHDYIKLILQLQIFLIDIIIAIWLPVILIM